MVNADPARRSPKPQMLGSGNASDGCPAGQGFSCKVFHRTPFRLCWLQADADSPRFWGCRWDRVLGQCRAVDPRRPCPGTPSWAVGLLAFPVLSSVLVLGFHFAAWRGLGFSFPGHRHRAVPDAAIIPLEEPGTPRRRRRGREKERSREGVGEWEDAGTAPLAASPVSWSAKDSEQPAGLACLWVLH